MQSHRIDWATSPSDELAPIISVISFAYPGWVNCVDAIGTLHPSDNETFWLVSSPDVPAECVREQPAALAELPKTCLGLDGRIRITQRL
jgi:hypothetical protein